MRYLILLCLAAPLFAQNPGTSPCSRVTNSATSGQVLSAASTGKTPPCTWAASGSAQIPTANLVAHWDFTNGSGTTVTDKSGNGWDLTLASGANQPTWVSGGGLSFVGANFQYAYASASLNPQSLQTACALVDNSSVGPSVNGFVQQTIIGTSGSNGWTVSTTAYGQSSTDWQLGSAFPSADQTTSYDTAYGKFHVCAVRGSSSDTLYINGVPVNNYSTHAGTLSGTSNGVFVVGGNPGNGEGGGLLPLAGNYSVFNGKIFDVAIYSSQLTAAQVAQEYSAVVNHQRLDLGNAVIQPTPNPSTSNQYVCVGDSLTAGTGSTVAGGYCATARLVPVQTFSIQDVGIGGLTVAHMLDMAANGAGGQSQLKTYSPYATYNIMSLWGGTNDICAGNGFTPAQALQNTLAFVRAARASGWTVLVATMISRGGTGTGGGSCDSVRDVFNPLLRSNIPGSGAYLVDLAATSTLGCDGCYSNTTYFQGDQTHLTDAGYVVVAGIQTAIANMVTQGDGVRTIAANATAYGGEYWRCNGTATVTLPDASGLTGVMESMANIAAGTCTLASVNGETIGTGAATTLVVASGTPKVIQSNGVNWDIVQ